MGDLYYLCLLRLRADRLATFLAKLQDGLDKNWCMNLLKNGEEEVEPPEPDDDDIADLDGNGDPDLGMPLVPLMLDHSLEWKRCKAISADDDISVKVVFDHLTGGSGKQRCYANCSGSHESCHIWRTADVFSNRDEAALFFFAWSTNHAQHASRTEHMAWQPDQSLVEGIRARVRFVEW
jgi:hypothetical protein